MPCQSRNCNKHGYLIYLHLCQCERVSDLFGCACKHADLLPKSWPFDNGSCLMDYSTLFRKLSFWCMVKTTRHVHTICSNSMIKHSINCVVEHPHYNRLKLPCYDSIQFTLNYITQQGPTFSIDTQLYQTINMNICIKCLFSFKYFCALKWRKMTHYLYCWYFFLLSFDFNLVTF